MSPSAPVWTLGSATAGQKGCSGGGSSNDESPKGKGKDKVEDKDKDKGEGIGCKRPRSPP